jgi:hypothetical protein
MIYSNSTLDEIVKQLEQTDYQLAKALSDRINPLLDIEKAYNKEIKRKDEECDPVYCAVTAMEYLCDPDLKWIKVDYKDQIVYYVNGFCEDSHYENHEISIRCNKSIRTTWEVKIQCGEVGETSYNKFVNGNFKEAQKVALQTAKNALISGSYFIIP